MTNLTSVVQIRFAYLVQARIKGRPVAEHVVSDLGAVRFDVVDPRDAPVVARLNRPRDLEERHRGDPAEARAQTIEYRDVGGVLMRQVLEADGRTPLTVGRLSALSTAAPEAAMACWRDHPAPKVPRKIHVDESVLDRSASGLKDFAEDGREAAHMALLSDVSRMRVVGGVVHRQCPAPVRCFYDKGPHVAVAAAAIDYDVPALRQEGLEIDASTYGTERSVPFGFAGAAVSVETLVSAIRSRHDGEVVADASDIEILDPDLLAASKADRANLRLLFHGVESGVLCPWRGMEPALRSFLARITEAAHDGYVGDGDPSAAMAAVRDLLLRASHLVDSRPMPPAYSYVPVLVRTVAAGWLGAEAAEASLDLADAPSFGT